MVRADASEATALTARGSPFDAVVIAASLGGRVALEQVIGPLPADFPAPIFVVQHQAASSPGYLPEILSRSCRIAARYARSGERPLAGAVYLAPPDRHLLFGPQGECVLFDGQRVNFARPAADVLFRSAASSFGPRALAVVLTGRLHDGAAGAAAIRDVGGVVLAQDPATCEAPEMPRAVIRRRVAHFTLPPAALSAALISLVAVPGMRELFGLTRGAA